MRKVIVGKALWWLAVLMCLLIGVVPAGAAGGPAGSGTGEAGLNPPEMTQLNGEIAIYIMAGDIWMEAGSLPFDKYLREGTKDLGGLLTSGGPVKMRLVQKGGGAAHLDSVFLGGAPPLKVNGGEVLPLNKLSKKDLDVITVESGEIDLEFPAAVGDAPLAVTARIEGLVISQVPFQFPLSNLFKTMDDKSDFYTYTLNSNPGIISVDENLAEVAGRKPFFKEYVRPGSGHPPGLIYGWVMNDDENLYITLDTTPDNTLDGDKDYAKVYVKTADGVKEFKVSVPETRWGRPGFTYTDKVSYQHKVYEFSIPLREIGINCQESGREIPLAFSAYGTMAPAPGKFNPAISYSPDNDRYLAVYEKVVGYDYYIDGQFINPDGSLSGSEMQIPSGYGSHELSVANGVYGADRRYLVVWKDNYNSSIHGQLVNADNGTLIGGNISISGPAALADSPPSVAFDTLNERFLVVWEDYRYPDTGSRSKDIYAQFINVDGSLSGSNFYICDNGRSGNQGEQYNPAVASGNGKFLVVWTDFRNFDTNDIYGQLVDGNTGNLTGTASHVNFPIATGPYHKEYPSVSFGNGKFFAAWAEQRPFAQTWWDIYGQVVNTDGTLSGGSLAVSSEANSQQYPTVAYAANGQKFLVAWEDQRNVYKEIYGQYVKVDTGLQDGNFIIHNAGDTNKLDPDAAYNSTAGNFLVAFEKAGDIAYTLTSSQDAQAPSWPGGRTLSASGIGLTSLTLTWTEATDNVGVDGYRVYRGENLIETVSGAVYSYNVTGLSAGIQYTFKIEAGDAAGNWTGDGPSENATTLTGGGSSWTPVIAPPPPPGTIKGKVTGLDKTTGRQGPMAGVRVTVFQAVEAGDPRETSTGTDGSYVIEGLAPGSYKVYFSARSGNYSPEWFNNRQQSSKADTVTISAGSVFTADAVLNPESGVIAGKLTATDEATGRQAPLGGAAVYAFPASGSEPGPPKGTLTRPDGSYIIEGLVPGKYKIEFAPETLTLKKYLPEWYNDIRTWRQAETVMVNTGEVFTANANMDPVRSGTIRGTLTGISREAGRPVPLAGMSVFAFPALGNEPGTKVTLTGPDGTFTIDGLVPGKYKIQFAPESTAAGQYLPEWYNNGRSLQEAELISVEADGVYTADAVMELPVPKVLDKYPYGDGERYFVIIPAGAVKDSDGNELTKNFNFTFTTGGALTGTE